jgi:hypothetical protein
LLIIVEICIAVERFSDVFILSHSERERNLILLVPAESFGLFVMFTHWGRFLPWQAARTFKHQQAIPQNPPVPPRTYLHCVSKLRGVEYRVAPFFDFSPYLQLTANARDMPTFECHRLVEWNPTVSWVSTSKRD